MDNNEVRDLILQKIHNKELSKIENLILGTLKIKLLRVDNEQELKRFAHLFSQCDLNNLSQTINILSRGEFIRDITFRYRKELGIKLNLICFFNIQKIRILAHLNTWGIIKL